MAQRSGFGFFIYATVGIALAIYFAFAAVQGDLGVFQRIAANAEHEDLMKTKNQLQQRVDELSNKTRRLSDDFLDLDLLDERARTVLGVLRSNDLMVR